MNTPCPPRRAFVASDARHRGQGCTAAGSRKSLRQRLSTWPVATWITHARSTVMADTWGTIAPSFRTPTAEPPRHEKNCPPSAWNGVRHQNGIAVRDRWNTQLVDEGAYGRRKQEAHENGHGQCTRAGFREGRAKAGFQCCGVDSFRVREAQSLGQVTCLACRPGSAQRAAKVGRSPQVFILARGTRQGDFQGNS